MRLKSPVSARTSLAIAAAAALSGSPAVHAQSQESGALAPVLVEGSRSSLLESAETANTGVVTRKQLEARTVYRPGEVLEATPGLVVSQHSGEGKANQFYLRGFNLDHGTDLRTTIDGMVVNQRSHSHGQGWTDLNFMIPELVDLLEYRKGPFYAAEGDFAAAGAVHVSYVDKLSQGIASLGVGSNGFVRSFVADSPKAGNGNLLYALELFHNDGPFVVPANYRKANGVLRYSEGTRADGFNLTAMAYRARWHATDQIPQRALADGTLASRFDAIDQTDGGEAERYSLSGAWARSQGTSSSKVNAYFVRNTLKLFSNFTYFMDDPVNGDQFAQPDARVTAGLDASHTWDTPWLGKESESTVGLQFQHDNIFNALQRSVARQTLSTTRQDHILESSIGIYLQNTTRWSPKFRTVAGARADVFRFDVRSDLAANSGRNSGSRVSPKLNLIFGPWAKTELYASAGTGFHSNDARGTTVTVQPGTGVPVDKVTPLVGSRGLELGLRSEFVPGLQSTLSVYRLDVGSELVFVGDAGTTEAGRASRRVGFEFSNYWRASKWLTVDADVAFARARFRSADPVGDRIPGAVEGVASVAFAVDNLGPYFGALQLRYFGPRPLVEDNSVRSGSTLTWNGRIGYKVSANTRIELEGYNLTNRKSSAIDYYYESRLRGEPAPVADIHFHPTESRSFRLSLSHRF
ncbi:MAG: TonB-dependent receptor [Ramlibacter sp.]|nr:TonB-dependent receptor [Ramlibacter sp.]